MKYALALILIFGAGVYAQDPEIINEWPKQYYPEPVAIPDEPEPECDHESNSAKRFALIRILPALKVISFTGKELDYVHSDNEGNYVGKLTVNDKTVMSKDFWKTYKDSWFWIMYCSRDGHAYVIAPLSPAQAKGMKGKP